MPGSDHKYIYIFNDLLKKHNALQPKYHPVGKIVQTAKASTTSTTVTTKEKPSISLSDVSTNSVVPEEQNSSRRTTSGASNISTTAQPSSTSNNIVSTAQSTNSYVKSNTFSSSNPLPSVSASFTAGYHPSSPIMTNKKSPRQPSSATDTAKNSSTTHTATTSYIHHTQTGNDANNNTTAKFLPPAASKHKRATTTHKHHTTFKDSAPNVSQTPTAVMGNSSTQGMTKRKSPARSTHTSMAKTIAEQTPNAFRTLGPGFNRGAEKSFNKRSNSLSSSNVPSDYEHIFHAPSTISDLPGIQEDPPNEADKKRRKTTNR